jgi:hypothetical protein
MRCEDAFPGQWVVYYPVPGGKGEDGEVVRVTERGVIFVRYRNSGTPKATRAEDLYAAPGGAA